MKIAIIDIIGLPYDGTTVFKQGLGGSESAVTFMSAELAALGFEVTVFNNCDIDHARAGIYQGVTYRPLTDLAQNHYFDVVVSSRTIIPFMEPARYPELQDNRAMPLQVYNIYNRICKQAKIRVLWMHDTFCLGDNFIEELAVENRITDIFTLSDFHLTYVANCHHGRRRNFEVLKNKLFITRNGAHAYKTDLDIAAKDRNLFVYNASVTKGMIPLVNEVWPRVHAAIPQARLKVIGGYYRFSERHGPDQQEKDWRAMVADPKYSRMNIEFTGVIPQKDIAEILTKANFMIYPGAFPETFGISSLESLLYNTPVATCRFGALEEIVPEGAGYHLNYAVEPNVLFTDINRVKQCELFAEMVIKAYNNPYLHQQKQYYCNIVKDVAGWDSVALQWKQWFFKKTGLFLSRNDYRKVNHINNRVHKIWGRRYTNTVEFAYPKTSFEQTISVVSTFYNAAPFIDKFIHSIASQDYDNYKVYMVNDASTDNTKEIIESTLTTLPEDIRLKFHLINNDINQGAVANQVAVYRSLGDSDSIVMIIDGDDWLVNDNSIFSYFNSIYDGTTEFTYGSCWSVVDNIPLISQPYPDSVKENGSFRQHHFNWILPYTHLRTFKSNLIKNIPDSNFQDENGNWFRAGGDGSVFYSLIEAADPDKIKCISDVVYNYNDTNPLNDYKVNGQEQNLTARKIVSNSKKNDIKSNTKTMKNTTTTAIKKILIAIPTAKNIEVETFKSIYDLEIPAGYHADFQYFYGYNIDQVRNLIADWVVKGYDYLFSVDSDIAFTADTLKKLLSHDVDVVCGLYIQRKPGQHILEVYEHNDRGGVNNIPYEKIKGRGLVEIAGCGFGCTLVKGEVMRTIPYPHFRYHSALDHRNTISEDVDFCRKTLQKGFKIWADTTVQCRHIGSTEFVIDNTIQAQKEPVVDIQQSLRNLGNQRLLPYRHVEYLEKIKNGFNFRPQVIYDIGSCVLHWTNEARRVWPESRFILFEAMDTVEFLYKEKGYNDYYIGVLSDQSGKTVEFWQNDIHPGGNSYYKENVKINPDVPLYFNESHRRTYLSKTLTEVVEQRKFPQPDLIKMDVQGAELDIVKGATSIIQNAKHVILELQKVEYNTGAPLYHEVVEYMKELGFDCLGLFADNGPDGDYHFVKRS